MSGMFGKAGEEGMDDLEIDDLLQQLSPEELELLVGDVDPDDSLIPACDRISYKCAKEATGPLDRKKLINHINDQALQEPDRPELVPYVAGTVRGKKWVAPPPPQTEEDDDVDLTQQNTVEVDVDLDDEMERVLNAATEDEIVDLAAVLGFHSMMNQEQYHASLLNKGKPMGMGWGGITKATKFKPLPEEAPNLLDPVESTKKLKVDDKETKDLNFNNVQNISDEQFKELFDALDGNTKLEVLSMSNTGISDRHIEQLCKSLQVNGALKTLNLETNNISPNGIVRIIDAIGKQHSVEEVRLANQRSSILGNKIEMQLTELIEGNPTVLRVGIHFEFNDARNRVSRHLQKNLDTFRVTNKPKRVTKKVHDEAASLSFVLPPGSGGGEAHHNDDAEDEARFKAAEAAAAAATAAAAAAAATQKSHTPQQPVDQAFEDDDDDEEEDEDDEDEDDEEDD